MPQARHLWLPSWRSPRLQGLRSARVRCRTPKCGPVPLLGIRPAFAAWALRVVRASQHGSAHGLCSPLAPWSPTVSSGAGPSASSPREAVPRCLQRSPPPWRFRPARDQLLRALTRRRQSVCVGLTSAPAKQAARPLAGLPFRGFPACCPPTPLSVGRPSRCFSHPQGFRFSRRPLRPGSKLPGARDPHGL